MPDALSADNEAITVHNLSKRYGTVTAVNNISFAVREGEFFGFLGPNGAGKTTTVRMLTGVIEPDVGTALIKGSKAGSIKAKQIAGVVPEMANAYIDFSGWNNIMLMADLYGIASVHARERGQILLRSLGLFDRKEDLVKTYSKGMRQRLILGMALVSDPEVLFLDEPTSGLDVQSTRLIKDMLRSLNSAGKTIFLTTHDMDEANQLCDRVAIINKGRIVAIDAPEKLRTATRGRNSIEVSFSGDVDSEKLAELVGVEELEKIGDKYRLYTDNPGELVAKLVDYSRAAGIKILTLNTLSPSLEDAFVALTEKEDRRV
jgi:ABC-2 type transport system ATP-binding protein